MVLALYRYKIEQDMKQPLKNWSMVSSLDIWNLFLAKNSGTEVQEFFYLQVSFEEEEHL